MARYWVIIGVCGAAGGARGLFKALQFRLFYALSVCRLAEPSGRMAPMSSSTPDTLLTTDSQQFAARVRSWLAALWPAPVLVNWKERGRAAAGATVGILFAALAS